MIIITFLNLKFLDCKQMSKKDPFDYVKQTIEDKIICIKCIQKKSNKTDYNQIGSITIIEEIYEDLEDLDETINIVKTDPVVWNLTPKQILDRKNFIDQTREYLNTLQKPPLEYSSGIRIKIQDEKLETVATQVSISQLGLDVQQELVVKDNLLYSNQDHVNILQKKSHQQIIQFDKLLDKMNNKKFCLVLVLIVILIILIFSL